MLHCCLGVLRCCEDFCCVRGLPAPPYALAPCARLHAQHPSIFTLDHNDNGASFSMCVCVVKVSASAAVRSYAAHEGVPAPHSLATYVAREPAALSRVIL